MSKEQFMTPATNTKPGQLVEMDVGDDEVLFLEPSSFDKDGKLVPGRAVRAEHVADDAADDDEVYVAPVSYFEEARQRTTAAANSMSAQIDELRQTVLQRMADVKRTSEGSVERGHAEAALMHAEDRLRDALRVLRSQLEASLAARPTPEARAELEGDLVTVKSLLDAIEPTKQGKFKPSEAQSTNTKKKTVMVLQRAAELLGS